MLLLLTTLLSHGYCICNCCPIRTVCNASFSHSSFEISSSVNKQLYPFAMERWSPPTLTRTSSSPWDDGRYLAMGRWHGKLDRTSSSPWVRWKSFPHGELVSSNARLALIHDLLAPKMKIGWHPMWPESSITRRRSEQKLSSKATYSMWCHYVKTNRRLSVKK